MPSSLSNFWTGGEGVRGVKGGMVRGEVQGSVLVGNTGVGLRKSEGGTGVEEETQINEGRACGNKLNLFSTHTHLWQACVYKLETCNSTCGHCFSNHPAVHDSRIATFAHYQSCKNVSLLMPTRNLFLYYIYD